MHQQPTPPSIHRQAGLPGSYMMSLLAHPCRILRPVCYITLLYPGISPLFAYPYSPTVNINYHHLLSPLTITTYIYYHLLSLTPSLTPT